MLVGLVNDLPMKLGRGYALTHVQQGLAPETLSDRDGRLDGGSNNCDKLRAPLLTVLSAGRGGLEASQQPAGP